MQSLPTVLLRPGEADRVLAGHPWIYHASILRIITPAGRVGAPSPTAPQSPIPDGAVVQVKDHRQRLLGVGFWNSKSKIRVRLLSRERIDIDADFFRRRIADAHALRRQHLPHATSYRLVNSESDFLTGLIIDKYQDVLVLQLSALGMHQRKHIIIRVLHELFSPRAILERTDIPSRKFEGITGAPEAFGVAPADTIGGASSVEPSAPATLLFPPDPQPSTLNTQLSSLPVQLNGLTFHTDLTTGHKTGMYLDQQQNYQHVADFLTRGRDGAPPPSAPLHVLDCFTFNGAFALHCAAALARSGGASSASPSGPLPRVHAIDQSPEAIAQAQRNAASNNLSEICTFETANVFDWLKAKTTTPPHEKLIPRYDLIILDPPSFTRNRASVPDALRGYKEIHLRALKLLKSPSGTSPGGILATFCCSHHVDANLFQQVILDAAYDALSSRRASLRRIATYTQSPDHPVLPAIPETEYLKGFAFQLTPNF